MPTYRVADPISGKSVKLTGDSPPTEEELNQIFSAIPSVQKKPSLQKRAWQALSVPEKMALQLLEPTRPLSTEEPRITPSIKGTLVSGTPRVLEELAREIGKFLTKTKGPTTGKITHPIVSERPNINDLIAGMVSPEALATGGALRSIKAGRPLLSGVRKGVLKTLEKTSGIAPRQAGALEAAYRDPTLLFAKTKEAGRPFYEAAKTTAKETTDELTKVVRPGRAPKVVSESIEKLNEGTLKPIEALKARKATDVMIESKTYLKDDLIPLRQRFDAVAKTDPNIATGDALVARGIKASAIRQLLPTNVAGTFSSFRTGIGGGAAMLIPGGKFLAPIALSPVIQGMGATSLGALSKIAGPVLKAPLKTGVAIGAVKGISGKKQTEKPENPTKESDDLEIKKPLTKEKAYEFFKIATRQYPNDSKEKNKKRARRMAKRQGYTWEGDF